MPLTPQQIPSRTETQYDGAGRVVLSLLRSNGAIKNQTATTYNGVDEVSVKPPAGGTPTSTFTNTLGKTGSLVQYLSADPSGTAETTRYAYDVRGDMTSMIDPAGNTWTWAFDSLGRNTSASDPDTGTTKSVYDDANRVTSTTDARGQVLAYSYDNLDPANRKTGEFSGSTAGPKLAAWTYDTLDKGQPTSSVSYVGSTATTVGVAYSEAVTGYDVGDQPTGSTVTLPSNSTTGALAGSYTTRVAYNSSEQVVSQTDPAEGGLAAESLFSDYDAYGDVTGVQGAAAYVNTAIYSPLFQLEQYSGTAAGSVSTFSTYSVDQATGRVADINNTVESAAGSFSVVADHAYGYDDAGEVTSETTTGAGVATDTQCFSYDHLQDLVGAWTPAAGSCGAQAGAPLGGPAPYSTSYVVNPASGNRTSVTQSSAAGVVSTATYAYPAGGAASACGVVGQHGDRWEYCVRGVLVYGGGVDGDASGSVDHL